VLGLEFTPKRAISRLPVFGGMHARIAGWIHAWGIHLCVSALEQWGNIRLSFACIPTEISFCYQYDIIPCNTARRQET
jgi:hypothetical protein